MINNWISGLSVTYEWCPPFFPTELLAHTVFWICCLEGMDEELTWRAGQHTAATSSQGRDYSSVWVCHHRHFVLVLWSFMAPLPQAEDLDEKRHLDLQPTFSLVPWWVMLLGTFHWSRVIVLSYGPFSSTEDAKSAAFQCHPACKSVNNKREGAAVSF